MKLRISYKNKSIEIPKIKKVSELGKIKGLMFTTSLTTPLLFDFQTPTKTSIHSFFVFYSFLAIWLNENKIIDFKIVHPFKLAVSPKKPFTRLIEIPINNKNKKIIDFIVGK
ncbi:MAG: DUF192 domain-containing protein [Nanoarchaeota archaeon]|nr:DUF192 domain-containing protein [Nanoarchaeota archaeon]